MADRPIDRKAWGKLVAGLIANECGGRKAAFARRAGVDPKTIAHWLAGNVDVSESSLRRVAEAFGRRPMDLLVEVGYYRADEVGERPAEPAQPPDPELDRIRRSNLSPAAKARLIQRITERRARDLADLEDLIAAQERLER